VKTFLAKIMGVGSAVWNFYGPILRNLFVTGTSALLPLALDIVRELAATEKSSAEKRDTAIARLKTEATAVGINATESLIRFTIESAVQRIRI
jgi:hypothetical protein